MSPSAFLETLADDPNHRPPMDEAAFLAIYARTASPLSGYLQRLTGSRSTAEDLLQDTYVRLLSLSRWPKDDEHLKNFMYRIATNLARDYFRRAGRQQSLDATHEPIALAAEGQDRDVWTQLALVSARDRELLLLAYVEGMTHREIAVVTGLMRASIRPLLFRARRRFAARLRQVGISETVR